MGKYKITEQTKNIHCRVKIGNNPETDGTILRQKSSKRFFVTDGKNNGICQIVDIDEGKLIPNTMTLSIKTRNNNIKRIETLTNKFAVGFDKKRYLISGAESESHYIADVITDEEKAKIEKPKKISKSKTTTKKKPTKKATKAKTTKKPVKKVEKVAEEEVQTETSDKTISTFSIVQN